MPVGLPGLRGNAVGVVDGSILPLQIRCVYATSASMVVVIAHLARQSSKMA